MQTTLTDYVYMDLSFGSYVFCGERAMAVAIAAGDNDFIAVAIVGDSNQPAVPSRALPSVGGKLTGGPNHCVHNRIPEVGV